MLSMARHALGMRIAVPPTPCAGSRQHAAVQKAPQDITITRARRHRPRRHDRSMGTTVRAGASIRVDQLEVSDAAFKVTLRLSDVTMKVLGESFTPVAGLIKSGALDLSKPGNLAKFMPKRSPVLVEAHDDILVLDLMQNPKFAANARVRGILGMLTPVVQVAGLSTEGDFLILQLRASPFGIPRALNAARALAAG
jgi:hypothetical protein